MSYERIIAAVAGECWALEKTKAAALASFLNRKSRGESIPEHEIQAAVSQKRTAAKKRSGGATAVIPIFGTLLPRATWMTEVSGLMSYQEIGVLVDDMAADDSVSTIVLDVDSPGGAVSGCQELADKIAAAAKKKPVIAIADCLAGSAALWLASQATEFVVSPSSQVGSIGVFVAHVDQSEADRQQGVQITFVSAGEKKTAGHPHAPLDLIGREELQTSVNDSYQQFVKAVARGRKTTQTNVRDNFGKGGMLRADAAVRVGMADRIGTIDDVLRPLGLRMTSEGPAVLSASSFTPRPVASGDREPNWGVELRKRRLALDKQQQQATATTATRPTTTNPYRILIAHHEASHLVARFAHGDRSASASIVPTDKWLGACFPGERLDQFEEAICLYAGPAGEDLSPEQRPLGSGTNDHGDERQLLALGLYPQERYSDARKKARNFVSDNSAAIRAVAGQLIEHGTISAADTAAVLSNFYLHR